MLAAALRGDVGHGALQNFKQRLLHPLAADVAGDGGVFGFAGDFVDLIHVDDAVLRLFDVVIRRLDQTEKNIFHVLADVTGLGQGGGIRNGKGHVEGFRQRLGKKRFADAGGAEQQNVALDQLHVLDRLAVNALIVVVHSHAQGDLCRVLADHVLVEPGLDILGLGQFAQRLFCRMRRFFVPAVNDRQAVFHTFVADIGARALDHHADLVLRAAAERAADSISRIVVFRQWIFLRSYGESAFVQDLIHQAVGAGFFRRHEVVAVGIALNDLKRLAGLFRQDAVELVAGTQDMVGSDLDIGRLPLGAAQRLVDHDLGVGQRITLAGRAGSQQECAHARRHAEADGGHVALDILHGVEDRKARGNGSAGGINVEGDILFGVLPFQKQKLRHHKAGGHVVDLLAEHNDTVVEEP